MLVDLRILVVGCLALVLVSCGTRPKLPSGRVVVPDGDAAEEQEPNDEPAPPKVKEWLAPQALDARVSWVTPACVERVRGLVGQMTLPEKIGQMTQPLPSLRHCSALRQFAVCRARVSAQTTTGFSPAPSISWATAALIAAGTKATRF